jgi:CHAT domain-containing protein/Tfp pilus assembly protein PilF
MRKRWTAPGADRASSRPIFRLGLSLLLLLSASWLESLDRAHAADSNAVEASDSATDEGKLAEANTLVDQVGQLVDQGRYADAVPLAQKALALRDAVLGPNHADVALSLNDLGELYDDQGLFSEAEPLFKLSLAIREKALGPEADDVALSLSDLAGVYAAEGRYAEAEPLYKRSLAIREKMLGPNHPYVALILNNLATLYMDQGRYAEVEPLLKRSLSIDEQALGPNDTETAQGLNNLAEVYRELGRYADAEPLYKRSLGIYEQVLGPDHPNVATLLSNLGLLYCDQHRDAEAEPLYKRGLQIREKALGPDHPSVANSLELIAVLYRTENRFAEAEPIYRRSLAIAEKAFGPEHPDVATALNNLAELFYAQGRYADAEPLYKRGIAIREKALGPLHPDLAISINNLAELYRKQGRYSDAEPLLKRSLDILQQTLGPDHPAVANGLNNLAELYDDQGRGAEALDLSRRAIAILEQRFGAASAAPELTDGERRAGLGYFVLNVSLEAAIGGPAATAASFRVAQLANASSAAQAVAGMAARFAAGSDALATVVRERQDLAGRQQALDKAILKAAGVSAAKYDAQAENALRKEASEMASDLATLDRRIGREFPKYAELSNPKALDVDEAQALLGPDEAMLVYLLGAKESWLWVLRHDRAGLYKLDVSARTVGEEVTKLRMRLDPALNTDLVPFDAERAYSLYLKIVAPAAAMLEGAKQVFVVPDGALESLPLQVLVTEEPKDDSGAPSDYRRIAWFAREHALSVLPSVATLRALRQLTTAGHAPKPFVGIGNPILAGTSGPAPDVKLASVGRGPVVGSRAVRQLPPLPETADELRRVAKDLGASDSDLYLGARASEPVLRQAKLDRYRIIEFATHGLMSGDLPGLAEPALVLTPPVQGGPDDDGLLTSSKIATFKLDADWVVLSACNTAAAGDTPDAGGLSGLAKAFFYAGARSLLVSNWETPSQATVRLVTGVFGELKKDPTIGRAEALRRAEMAMLDPTSPPTYAQPMFWAAFVVAGEGSGRSGR